MPTRRSRRPCFALLVSDQLPDRVEVLFGGAIYHMDDAADNYSPARVAFKRALRDDGVLPSWEPGSLCG